MKVYLVMMRFSDGPLLDCDDVHSVYSSIDGAEREKSRLEALWHEKHEKILGDEKQYRDWWDALKDDAPAVNSLGIYIREFELRN